MSGATQKRQVHYKAACSRVATLAVTALTLVRESPQQDNLAGATSQEPLGVGTEDESRVSS